MLWIFDVFVLVNSVAFSFLCVPKWTVICFLSSSAFNVSGLVGNLLFLWYKLLKVLTRSI